jgi:hypothetical protein
MNNENQVEIRPLASRIARELTLEEINSSAVSGGVEQAGTGHAGGHVSHGSEGWDGGVGGTIDF